MNYQSEPIYQAALTVEFDSTETRDRFLATIRDLLTPEQLQRTELKTRATCCRLCGIDRKFQTLGSGIAPAWDAVDECRGAHVMSCQRRQKANAATENAS